MKVNTKLLPVAAAGLGILALLARIALYLLGRDEKGLLISGHPLELLVWAATAAAILILAFVWKLDGSARYAHNFAPSVPAAIGSFALAGGITVCVILSGGTGLWLGLLSRITGFLAIPAIVWAGLCRYRGKRPFFLLHALVCLYLMLYLVNHYQTWSSRPQMQDWFFSMLGILFLALFGYYQTTFDVNMGKRRMQLCTGLLAGFFCIAAAAGGEDVPLYIGGAAWALTGLCSLTPVPRRRKNPITEAKKDPSNDPA